MSFDPQTFKLSLTLSSMDFWRTQRAVTHATLPMWLEEHPHYRSLSSQVCPLSSERLHVTDEKTEAPGEGK